MPKVKRPQDFGVGKAIAEGLMGEAEEELEEDPEYEALSDLGHTLAVDDLTVEDLFAGLICAGMARVDATDAAIAENAYSLASALCAERAKRTLDEDDGDKT